MENFIGLDVEQSQSKISLHLDAYIMIQETLEFYKVHPGTKMIRAKTTLMQPGNVLTSADVQEMPDKKRQAFY